MLRASPTKILFYYNICNIYIYIYIYYDHYFKYRTKMYFFLKEN
ncbi:MAG: hypothetical protein N7Q72_03800 [Spiroplasma sp. Tabriz.8]|nr:hypothetical protein [Spiroplasma sp. Tabriz.8]